MFELKAKEWAEVTWMKKRTKRFPGRSENLLKETDQSQEGWSTKSRGRAHGKRLRWRSGQN